MNKRYEICKCGHGENVHEKDKDFNHCQVKGCKCSDFASMRSPLVFDYDLAKDKMTIEGKVYSGDFFRHLSYVGLLPRVFSAWDDGELKIKRIPQLEQIETPRDFVNASLKMFRFLKRVTEEKSIWNSDDQSEAERIVQKFKEATWMDAKEPEGRDDEFPYG